MLTLLKNTCFQFLEHFVNYNFILNNFKIKVMAPQIFLVNFLFQNWPILFVFEFKAHTISLYLHRKHIQFDMNEIVL